jgi:hypothetical protein
LGAGAGSLFDAVLDGTEASFTESATFAGGGFVSLLELLWEAEFPLLRKSVTYHPVPFRMNEVLLTILVIGPPLQFLHDGGGSLTFCKTDSILQQTLHSYS